MCLHVKNRNNLTWFTFQVWITAVDIDPAMLEVATQYFELVQDERLDVYIRDGIEFIGQAAEKGLGMCQFMCSSSNSTYCNYICKVPGLIPSWVQLSCNNPLLWFYVCFSTFSRFLIIWNRAIKQNKALNYSVVGTSFHAVIIDVDNKTPGAAMNSPAPQFLELPLLQDIKKCVGDKGIVTWHLVHIFHQQKLVVTIY